MKSFDIKKYKIPNTPGVYFFRGTRGEVLYIGKATNLRNRVYSYFAGDISSKRSPFIAEMIEKAKKVTWQETDSVLEAVILEVNLIKKHKPKYNTKEKDDKSFNYVVITKEDFPRVLLVRAKELLGGPTPKLKCGVKYTFGPFPQGTVLKDALKIVRKIFPYRDKCMPVDSRRQYGRTGVRTGVIGKPCFNRQIELCPGICSGEISKREYGKTIQNIRLFFEGKKSRLIKKLQKEMKEEAKKLNFERAGELKKTIFALEHIHDIALIKSTEDKPMENFRIEAYDVAHISGKFVVGVMVVVEDGKVKKSDYRKFKVRSFEGVDDTRALTEILDRRFAHPEWAMPRIIAVDGGKAQKNTAEKVLRNIGVDIPVVGIVKDKRHKPKDIIGKKELVQKYEKAILLANSEAHRFAIAYHRQLRSKI